MYRTGLGDRLFVVEFELREVLGRGGRVGFPVFTLVLALSRDFGELIDPRRQDGRVANKLVHVACVAAQVAPGKNLVSAFTVLNSKMESLVEKECPLVAFAREKICVGLTVSALFFCKQFGFSLLEDPLHDKLVLEVLCGVTNLGGGVLEDEL